MKSPIILFGHQAGADRVDNLLRLTSLTNPKKRVILVEDQPSAGKNRANIERLSRDKYHYGARVDLLKQRDIGIGGGQNNFQYQTILDNVRNWCIVSNIMEAHDLQSCWVFDSNTLLLGDLEPYETVAQTSVEQLSLFRMTGFVANRPTMADLLCQVDIVLKAGVTGEAYSDVPIGGPTSISTTAREALLRDYLTEKQIVNNSAFIGTIYSLTMRCGETDRFETYSSTICGLEVRKIYIDEEGNMYLFHIPSNRLTKLVAVDLGRKLADRLYDSLSDQARRKYSHPRPINARDKKLTVFDAAAKCGDNFQSGKMRSQIERKALVVTEKLIQKLKKLREQDPNTYPLS
jgi:hypothetical protein